LSEARCYNDPRMRRRIILDPWIVGPTLILLTFSLIVLRSVLPQAASQQFLFAISGIAVFFLVSQINYRVFAELSRFLYVFACMLLVITFMFGQVTRGSVRWIEIGALSIQPSELIKPVMVLFLAKFVQTKSLRRTNNLILYSLLTALPVFLVLIQPDLGSSLVILIIGLSIAFAANTPLKVLAATLGGTLLAFPLTFQLLKPYQQDRLRAFIDPFSDPLGSGYNVIQSMIAVGSGRIFGHGLGHGTQSQLRFLPERYSDFIFASLAEELGFIGAISVLASYFALFYHFLGSLKDKSDSLASYIIVGVVSMLLFQVTVNISMNLGLLPITGITLPLVSSGGSSLLATMISLGIVHSAVARDRPQQTIEIR
jgi:rod shape determining protein RodA